MINREILKYLIPVTDEEQEILNGKKSVDKNLYMNNGSNIINSKKLLDEGKLITIRPHTRFVHFPKHTHDYVEVVYMCTGSSTHIVNNTKVVLNEGDLLFMSQNATQEILEVGGNDIAVNFIILPQFFDKTLVMLGEEETPLRRFIIDCLNGNSSSNGYLHFKVADVLPIQNLIENLLYTLVSDTPNKRQINQTTMGLLFLQLLNHTDRIFYKNDDNAVILEVVRYIEENYQNSSLTDISNYLHYDFTWLSREIKRKTGKTYTELLQEKRLSQAAFLLKNTKMNISDISVAVGYENISYFHRLFSKQFGASPKKYRDYK